MSYIHIYLFIKHENLENNSKNLTINNIYAVLHIKLIEVIGYYSYRISNMIGAKRCTCIYTKSQDVCTLQALIYRIQISDCKKAQSKMNMDEYQ